jgi:hypothetical protein
MSNTYIYIISLSLASKVSDIIYIRVRTIVLSQQSERYYVDIRVRTIVISQQRERYYVYIRVRTIVLSQQSERYYVYTC